MPELKQKYERPRHTPIPHESGTLTVCGEDHYQWDKNISRCDCGHCLEFLMQLGRWAETRYYELS